MKKRILSLLLALAMAASLLVLPAAADYDDEYDGDYGWDDMADDIAFRIVKDGIETRNLIIGEIFTLQLWLQNLSPYAMSIPIDWNPNVVTVVDPNTGVPVTSGKKFEGSPTGFRAGSKCYQTGYDIFTYQPLYWNGRPVYTVQAAEGDGYPYLDNEAGHYRFLYYVSSPNPPAKPQLILEISFKVLAKGDPGFHIATSADGAGRYDPAEPSGLSVILRSAGSTEELNFSHLAPPPVTVYTQDEYEEMLKKPLDSSGLYGPPPSRPGSSSSSSGTVQQEVETIPATHLNCFPYSNAAKTHSVLKNIDGRITYESEYILPASMVSDVINSNVRCTSLVVEMPDEVIDKQEYALNFSMTNVDDLADYGVSTLFVETPIAYIGLNTYMLANFCEETAEMRLEVSSYGSGLSVSLTQDGVPMRNFPGPVLRVVLPMDSRQLSSTDYVLIPSGVDVFGKGTMDTFPMSLCKPDAAHGVFVFLSPCVTDFGISWLYEQTFEDMEAAAWAEPYVNKLAQRNIINGMGDGTFCPNNNVTREQFTKLLIAAFGMYCTDSQAAAFSDVPNTSVFYPYVSSASAVGLVNGLGSGKFGASQTITRQDLIVIAYRGLSLLGVKLPQEREMTVFSDDAKIADYAKEAVYMLYSAGIIDGMGDGTFSPTSTATRAQAAKILCGVLDLVLASM